MEDSTLYLMKNVDLDPNYNYTIDFDSVDAQQNYFNSKIDNVLEINEGYSYIRFNEPINVYKNVEELFGVNYLMFTNNNRTYYAFILNKKWVSDECTAIEFKIDVFQTFMFNYEMEESFIEREHQDRFKPITSGGYPENYVEPIYNNKLENIEVGKNYKLLSKKKLIQSSNGSGSRPSLMWLQYICTESITKMDYSNSDKSTWNKRPHTLVINGVSTELYSYIIPLIYDSATGELSKTTFYTYNANGEYIFMPIPDFFDNNKACIVKRILPYLPVSYNEWVDDSGKLHIYFNGGYNSDPSTHRLGKQTIDISFTNNNAFGGVDLGYFGGNILCLSNLSGNYKKIGIGSLYPIYYNRPSYNELKNIENEPKLKTKPYRFIRFTNHQSVPLDLSYDNINTLMPREISLIQDVSNNYKSKLYINMKDILDQEGEINNTTDNTIKELPLKTDAYLNYMAQNKASATTGMALNVLAGVGTLALGVATGGIGLVAGAGMAISSGMQIANHITKMQDLKDTPDDIRQSGNNQIFNIINNTLIYYKEHYEIEEPYKIRVFNYLYHYGYICNDFKKPNTRSRYYFNYIKTIGANIKTNIDAIYKQQLAQIFDNGITIWHYRNKDTFKGVNNYDYENVEMNLMEE